MTTHLKSAARRVAWIATGALLAVGAIACGSAATAGGGNNDPRQGWTFVRQDRITIDKFCDGPNLIYGARSTGSIAVSPRDPACSP